MIPNDFISEALCQPADYLPYYVSRKLAEKYPESAISEGDADSFDPLAYAQAGLCSVVSEGAVHQQMETCWQGRGAKLNRELRNGWLSVWWPEEAQGREHLLEVLLLSYSEGGYWKTRYWVIADTPEIAERFLRAVCVYCDDVHGEILVFDDGSWQKDERLYEAIKNATFDNLVLPPVLQQEILADFRSFFSARAVYARYGVPWKRGVLFTGPPGNGKTHTIKALVNELRAPCLYVRSFKHSYDTAQQCMRRVFERARDTAPCLLVLEDLDALIDDENRSFLLNELDGFAENTGVVVVATTNHPEKLDVALLERPGRFDRKYQFALPAAAERRAYVAAWSASLQAELRLSESELERVVSATEEFSFAYLKELFVSSLMQWITEPTDGAGRSAMGEVLLVRAALLSEELRSPTTKSPEPLSSWERLKQPLHNLRKRMQKGIERWRGAQQEAELHLTASSKQQLNQ